MFFLTERGLTDNVFCKTALHRRRFTCCVTPKRFSLTRFSCFAPLLTSAADILQCKADALGFRSVHIISEASAFGKIIFIQTLVKIIVIFPLRCLKPFPLKFQRFSRKLSVV